MAEGKNKITIYRDWIDFFEPLTDEEAGKLIKHFLKYVNDLNPSSDRITELLFEPMKKILKRDLKKWEGVILEKSNSGRIGNIKRWHLDLYNQLINKKITIEEAEKIAESRKTSQNIADAIKTSQNIAVIDIVNDIVNVKEDSVLVKTASPYAKKIIPSLDEVIEYLVLEKNESQNEAEKFFDYYQANGWRVGKNPMKDWKAAARNWLKNKSNYNKQTLKTNENGKQLSKQELEQQEFNRRYGTTFGQ